MKMEGEQPNQFDWSELVPRLIHPIKVAVVEALLWIEEPLSPSDMQKVFAPHYGLSLVAYHTRRLKQIGVLEPVSSRPVRGATETFYFFAK